MAEAEKKEAVFAKEESKMIGKISLNRLIGVSITAFVIIALAMACYFLIPEDRSTITIKDDVTEIKENAYRNIDSAKAILIGKNVKKIGNWAFFGCTGVQKEVVVPAGVEEIGWAAFSGVKSVSVAKGSKYFFSVPVDAKNVKFSADGVTFEGGSRKAGSVIIGKKKLYMRKRVIDKDQFGKEIKTPDGGLRLASVMEPTGKTAWTLYYCPPTVKGEYVVPAGIEEIEHYAFYNCSELTKVVIPASVKMLGSAAFIGCKNLVEVDLPASISEIRRSTFEGCEKLASIKFDNITKIDYSAFRGCNALTKVVFADKLETIATYAFFRCENLVEAEIYLNDKTLEKSKSEKDESKKITLADGKKAVKIGHNAFNETHDSFKITERFKNDAAKPAK